MPVAPPSPPFTITSLIQVMATLRDPDTGCPWDREQDFASIAPYTIEEAYEVADAIARGSMDDLKDELGDLLLQTIYHARMAEEAGTFAFADVVTAICDKMIRRHPHVFAAPLSGAPAQAAEHSAKWEDLKAQERGAQSALAGVSVALPALTRALKIQKRAARVGFDWPNADGPRAKIIEELAECDAAQNDIELSAEMGDLLFSVVNWARHRGVDPEQALAEATRRFERRFMAMEATAGPDGLPGRSLDALEQLWSQAKIDTA